MALTTLPANNPTPPNELAEQAVGSNAVPNELTEQAVGTNAVPNELTEEAAVSPAVPNELTELGVGSVAVPNELTEASAGVVAVPNTVTEEAVASPAVPNELTELAVGSVAVPNELTELAAGSVAVPNELTELAAGSIAVPNELTEQAVAAFPRSPAPVLNMNFASQLYATNDNPRVLTDITEYTRATSGSFWNRRLNPRGKWETFLDTNYVGNSENLALYSEELTNADWSKTTSTLTAVDESHPMGVPVFKLEADGVGTFPRVEKTALALSGIHTFSVDVKAVDGDYCALRLGGTGIGSAGLTASAYRFYFNGEFNNATGATDSMVSSAYLGDGWWRITLTVTAATTIDQAGIYTEWSEALGKSLLITRPQITASGKELPYVRTEGSTVSQTFAESPRIEYDPVTAEVLGYLAEGASENLLLRSETFETGWTEGNTTADENRIYAPDGTFSASRLTEDSATSTHFIRQNVSVTIDTDYAFSVYLKKDERRYVRLQHSGVSTDYANFDLLNGTIEATSGSGYLNSFIQDCGDGWYRCVLIFDSQTTTTASCRVYILDDSQTVSYSGDGSSSIYLWGAQFEQKNVATSYIRTEGSTVTRNADLMYLRDRSNTKVSSALLEAKTFGAIDDSQHIFDFGKSTSNYWGLLANATTNGQRAVMIRGGSTGGEGIELAATSLTYNDFARAVFTWRQGEGILYRSDDTTQTDSNVSYDDGDLFGDVSIGHRIDGQFPVYGHIKRAILYGEVLTATEVAQL